VSSSLYDWRRQTLRSTPVRGQYGDSPVHHDQPSEGAGDQECWTRVGRVTTGIHSAMMCHKLSVRSSIICTAYLLLPYGTTLGWIFLFVAQNATKSCSYYKTFVNFAVSAFTSISQQPIYHCHIYRSLQTCLL